MNNIPGTAMWNAPLDRDPVAPGEEGEANILINETISRELSIDDLYVSLPKSLYPERCGDYDRAISYLGESQGDDSNPMC